MRVLLVRRGCPFCRDAIKVISKLNLKMNIDKRILIIDCYEWEEFKLDNNPLLNLFSKMEKEGFGYPFLYVDGIIIEPSPSPEQLKIVLKTFLREDILEI